jgi:putative FmdB family regulatory protein
VPTYTYHCASCDKEFEEFHLMSETLDKCILCDSPSIQKVLNSSVNLIKNKNFRAEKPGKIVKKYIEDVKKEIRDDKERLKRNEHNT